MQHGQVFPRRERLPQRCLVGKIGLDEFRARRNGLPVAGDEGIVHGDMIARLEQGIDGNRANVARAAGNENSL